MIVEVFATLRQNVAKCQHSIFRRLRKALLRLTRFFAALRVASAISLVNIFPFL
jgi:hypothetical protein